MLFACNTGAVVASLVVGLGLVTSACNTATDSGRAPRDRLPTAMTPLEPASGPARVTDQPWDSLTANGWNYLRRTSSKDADIVTDATAPSSPPHVLRITFTPGMSRDTEPGVHWTRLPEPREVHASWWVKLSANWTPSPAGAAKLTFLHTGPDGQGQVYTALGGASAPHSMVVNTEWAPYGQRFWEPNVTTSPIAYNRWYRVEWYVKWESVPRAGDGILRWWIDGVLNGDYRNVRFPDEGTGFQQFEFAPTVQKPPPADQYMYIDHTAIRTGASPALW
jgi:hypothetical protein